MLIAFPNRDAGTSRSPLLSYRGASVLLVLPAGGALIVYEAVIDDRREESLFGLLHEFEHAARPRRGFVFTGAECRSGMLEAGFARTEVTHLHGPDSMVVGYKER